MRESKIYGVVYKIQNMMNGKIYIGQTTQKPKKYFRETYVLHGAHKRIKLQNAIEKYGILQFTFVPYLDFAYTKDELDDKETFWIKYYNTVDAGYNCRHGGANGLQSEETKKKMSKSRTGVKIHTEEGKKKMRERMIGKAFFTGKKHSDKTKDKISLTKMGTPAWNKGIPMTEEHKAMLVALSKGRTPWNKGQKTNRESVEKMRASKIGKNIGMAHHGAKLQTIQNIETGEIRTGCLAEMARELNFSRPNMSQIGKTKGWQLIKQATI